MAIGNSIKNRIKQWQKDYERLKPGKESLLNLIEEAELPESVYNSNAIENSTLTLRETEKILLAMELSRDVNLREVFEAKNLARVSEYVKVKASEKEVDKKAMRLLHEMLITNIDDRVAGRFRAQGEYVRVGTHIAPAPEHVERLIEAALDEYLSAPDMFAADKIAKFHLDFETIHPFRDGNGRIGRVLINWQLRRHRLPPIIILNKEKQAYYQAFSDYRMKKNIKPMAKIIALAILESLHKRVTYLEGQEIIPLTVAAQARKKPAPVLLNAAKRQTIPAFREKSAWKIGKDFKLKPRKSTA